MAETAEEKELREKQEAAVAQVEKIATEKATEVLTAKHDELLQTALKGEVTSKVIKAIAQEVVDALDLSKFEIEDARGKKVALNKAIDEIQELVNKTNARVGSMSGMIDKQVETIMGQLKAQFNTPEKQAELKQVYSQKTGQVEFTLKAVDPITTASFGDRVIIGLREPGVDYNRLPERFIFDIISTMTGGPGSNPLSWVELNLDEGAPGWQTAEGAEKPSMNWVYVEGKVMAQMIAVWTPVSRQALLNWPMLEQEIRFELTRELFNELDNAVINGDGTGSSIYGIKYYATSFAAGSLAGTIPFANRGDVLRAAIGQVRKGASTASYKLGGFRPDYILVSEDTYTIMDTEKSIQNGQYLYPRFSDEAGTRIKGIPIIASNFLEDDEFIVGDFTRYLFNFVENLVIRVGYINDQFVKNLLTVLAEVYGMGRVKAHQRPAFVKGEFPAAIAALNRTS